MKQNFETSFRILVVVIFVIFAIILITQKQYGWAVLLVIATLIPLKSKELTELIFSLRGGLKLRFELPKEKIEENIKENNEPATEQNFIRFQDIESRILLEQQKKYKGEIKTLIHFMYGQPDKPEFMYTPDGSLNENGTLYFFEIKYILKPEFAETIVQKSIEYLKMVYERFAPAAGSKLVIKLILASGYDIDPKMFSTPKGIDLEFVKI